MTLTPSAFRPLLQLSEALQALQTQSALTFLLEHWDTGLQVFLEVTGAEVEKAVEDARQDFGCDRFGWQAFNRHVDVAWTGEGGLLYAGAAPPSSKFLFLESDTGRFPGMQRFAAALRAHDPKATLQTYRVEAVEVRTENHVGWRFLAIRASASTPSGGTQP